MCFFKDKNSSYSLLFSDGFIFNTDFVILQCYSIKYGDYLILVYTNFIEVKILKFHIME